MEILSLVLAIIALAIAIMAYQKTGGLKDIKRQIDHLSSAVDIRKSVDSLTTGIDTLRDKTADAIERIEDAIRGERKK